MSDLPTVSIVFLVFNRREELRTSLGKMLLESDYPAGSVDVIVVDNASEDGSAEMVRAEFPEVRLVERSVNVGVSGWNDGLRLARGDLVLVLDDDCYLPADGLRRAVAALQEHQADLVSFAVCREADPTHLYNETYRTGLLSFWGCAALMRREVVERLGGYDPEIFVWANELEFMVRFFDAGFRHLHAPEIVAVHIKEGPDGSSYHGSRAYRINARHFAYIAAKLFTPRDAIESLVALAAHNVRDALREDRTAIRALPETIRGFAHGLRHRAPVAHAAVSHTYRREFKSFASPWWLSRPAHRVLLEAPPAALGRLLGRPAPRPEGRKAEYFAHRARYYPAAASTLEMRP